jgi:heat shock protein HslJ
MGTHEASQKKNVYILLMVVIAVILVIILVYARITSNDSTNSAVTHRDQPFITIIDPREGERLDLTWAVAVRGQVGGVNGQVIIVQALDAAGIILAEEQTSINQDGSELGGTTSWELDLQINTTLGSQGEIVAFSPSPADESRLAEDRITVGYGEDLFQKNLVKIEDHLWRLASLNERPPIEDTILTIQFGNFQAAGFGGCNNFRSSSKRIGSSLNFGFVTSTAKECELPPGIMTQETAYFNALEQTTHYQFETNQLIINDSTGVERLVYDAVVMGTIFGPEITDLPEDAVMVVRLIDGSSSAPEPVIISESHTNGVLQLPQSYSLQYNPKQIIANHTYGLDVQILDSAGEVLLISQGNDIVFSGGYPSLVDVEVDQPSISDE